MHHHSKIIAHTAGKLGAARRVLLFILLIVPPLPSLGAQSLITQLSISATEDGDLLSVKYEGEIEAMLLSVNEEKHAILSFPKTRLSPSFKLNEHKGKLIKILKVDSTEQRHVKILIDFKRRLGRHSKKKFSKKGGSALQFEFLDEIKDPPPAPTETSIIQPLIIENGLFEIDGTKEKKTLDYHQDDRTNISTDEFLSLFGTQVRPRPNRITDIDYQLTSDSLKLVLSLHERPVYTLKPYSEPSRIELTLAKTLGDLEINRHTSMADFISDLTSTRHKGSLALQAQLHETTEATSKVIRKPGKQGYQLIINIQRIYPWETEAAIPKIDL